MQTLRQERILRSGSPPFLIKPGVITAGAFLDYDIDGSAELSQARKYKPLDFIEVVNNDVVDISLMVDFKDTYVIPRGTIRKFENAPWYTFRVKNLHSSTSTVANMIWITLQRLPITTDTYVQKFVLGKGKLL